MLGMLGVWVSVFFPAGLGGFCREDCSLPRPPNYPLRNPNAHKLEAIRALLNGT